MTDKPTFVRQWTVALVWLSLLCIPGCKSEFFVDKGQVESIQGVTFDIRPPHLFIKKAFNLRQEHLSPTQLIQLSEAMSAIAAFTYALLRDPNESSNAMVVPKGVRAPRVLMNLPKRTPLFVNTLQNWKVNPGNIEFTTDYFYTNSNNEFVNFRDNYAFALTPAGWQFSEHPQPQAEGLLSCTHSANRWRICEVLKRSP